jgi:hypothetical protein
MMITTTTAAKSFRELFILPAPAQLVRFFAGKR